DEPTRLIDHAERIETAAFPPGVRDDAERAAMLAAVLNLDERARATGRTRRRIDGDPRLTHVADLEAHESATSEENFLHERRQPWLAGVADPKVPSCLARTLVRARLGPASGHDDTSLGIRATRPSDRLPVGYLGTRRDRAGVDDHHVGRGSE